MKVANREHFTIFSLFLGLSVFLHLFLILLFVTMSSLGLWTTFQDMFDQMVAQEKAQSQERPQTITFIDPKDLPKNLFRKEMPVVGTKDGQGNQFYMRRKKVPKQQLKPGPPTESAPSKPLTLGSLQAPRPSVSMNQNQNEAAKVNLESSSTNGPKKPPTSALSANQLGTGRPVAQSMAKSLAPSLGALSLREQGFIDSADFNVGLIPPKGISEDELNKLEQIFYSFQKRMYSVYFSALMQTLRKVHLENPQRPHFPVDVQAQVLRAKVRFDTDGKILAIQAIKNSNDPLLQKFFKESLENMFRIPNPPKAFFKQDKYFEAIYQLYIID